MKTSTAGDLHCFAVSQQNGEISPQQEKSESNNTHCKPREERVWSVFGSSINTVSLLQSGQAGKPSVTFLNNSLSIIVIRRPRNNFTSNVWRESGAGCWIFGVNLRKWLDGLVLEVLLEETGPSVPPLCEVKFWDAGVTIRAGHKESVNILMARWLARKHWFEECENFYVKRAFYKSAMSHRGYLIAFCLRKHFCLGQREEYTWHRLLLYGVFREYPAIPTHNHYFPIT